MKRLSLVLASISAVFALIAKADLYEGGAGLIFTRENGMTVPVTFSQNFKSYCGRIFEDWSGRLQFVRDDGSSVSVFGAVGFRDYCGNHFVDSFGDLYQVKTDGSSQRIEFAGRFNSVRRMH